MKKLSAIALFAIANLAMAGTSFAQNHALKATIPFDFTVGDQLLPAGTYTIKTESGNIMVLRSLDKPIQLVGLTMPDNSVARGDHKLVFNRYRDQYFLRQILCDEADMDVRIPASKLEKKTQRQEASAHSNSQTYVAAR